MADNANHRALLKLLRKKDGAPITTTQLEEAIRQPGVMLDPKYSEYDNHPLFVALWERGDATSIVEFLLKKGADANARLQNGLTPLMDTAWHGQPNKMRLLLNKGADIDAITYLSEQGTTRPWTPLHYAIEGKYLDTVKLLLLRGASLTPPKISLEDTAEQKAIRMFPEGAAFIREFGRATVTATVVVETSSGIPPRDPNRDLCIPYTYVTLDGTARLGRGSLGEVLAAHYLGVPVAVKRLFALQPGSVYGALTPEEEDFVRSELQKECHLLARISSPFIVTYYGYTYKEKAADSFDIVDIGSLWQQDLVVMERLEGFSYDLLNPGEAEHALSCLARALLCLHTNNIIHRDVKPSNVLYDKKNALYKLSDLGEAKYNPKLSTLRMMTQRGTPHYMAPEIQSRIRGDSITNAADIFSFGVTALEMLTKSPPKPLDELFRHTDAGTFEQIPEVERRAEDLASLPEGQLKEFLLRCLAMAPDRRPSAKDCEKFFPLREP